MSKMFENVDTMLDNSKVARIDRMSNMLDELDDDGDGPDQPAFDGGNDSNMDMDSPIGLGVGR